jgi:LemA protein
MLTIWIFKEDMSMRQTVQAAIVSVLLVGLSGCGYNNIQSTDEETKASWSEVVNQYKRRADLIPNLVKTVQGYAKQEQDVFIKVTEARAKATSVNITPDMVNDPAAMEKFAAAQKELSSSLGRLLVVAENYPQLKSDQNFRDLQAQLEGTENRIGVARNRYIETIKNYNILVRSFPENITAKIFGYKEKAQFKVENEAEISEAPKVDFGQ